MHQKGLARVKIGRRLQAAASLVVVFLVSGSTPGRFVHAKVVRQRRID